MDWMWVFWNLFCVVLGLILAAAIWGGRYSDAMAKSKIFGIQNAQLKQTLALKESGLTMAKLSEAEVGKVLHFDGREWKVTEREDFYDIDFNQDKVAIWMRSDRPLFSQEGDKR